MIALLGFLLALLVSPFRFDRQLRPHGLRITQFSVLVMLILAGPLTIGELADKLSIERTTLSRNLVLIESAAWITIRPGDDARSRLVSVTAKGRAVVAASLGAWRRAQAAVAAAIGQSGVDALQTLSRSQVG
jgi:DNA-binding MarR family transcriptional regulator